MSIRSIVTGLPGVDRVRSALGHERLRRPQPHEYHREILSQSEGAEAVRAAVTSGAPALIARLGGMELDCLRHYLGQRLRRRPRPYPPDVRRTMRTNTGFFPITDESLDAFCRLYLRAVSQVDVMGVWFNPWEDRVVREHCPQAQLVPLRSIEPYYLGSPWTRELRGRRVLVVHPFAATIRAQYEGRRVQLFDDPDVLPAFHLRVVRAVQSAAGETPDYATWFDALASMEAAMDEDDYDVCIVGAGAYGLPLAAHAKACGRVGVHMGGATQILFGIKGRRWDDQEIASLYRPSWVRPAADEVPRAAMDVEDGCYW